MDLVRYGDERVCVINTACILCICSQYELITEGTPSDKSSEDQVCGSGFR